MDIVVELDEAAKRQLAAATKMIPYCLEYLAAREIEKLRAVADAAEGLAMGTDWNRGTHAKIHRPRLIKALRALTPNV